MVLREYTALLTVLSNPLKRKHSFHVSLLGQPLHPGRVELARSWPAASHVPGPVEITGPPDYH
eukprot:1596897-Amphidinium_carterae.1